MPLVRTSTGVPRLDQLIEGGFPSNRAVLLRGEPGTGKTIFGLQFLAEGLARGERAAFVSVDQKPQHLLHDSRGFKWDLESAVARGDLALLDASPYFTATRRRGWTPSGVDARQLASDLAAEICGIHARRVVIDSLTSLVPMDMSRAQAHDYLRSLIHSWEDNLDCTVLLIWRTSPGPDPQGSAEAAEYLATGVVDLKLVRLGHALSRVLHVRKMRGTRLDLAEYVFSIDPDDGVVLSGRAELVTATGG